MKPPPVFYQDDFITLYHADCLSVIKHLDYDCVVTDPPYNVGYHYEKYHDALKDYEYQELLNRAIGVPSVVIHYPEDMFVVAQAIGEYPEKCVAWVYNANTPRQWRMAAWFGIKPDFSLKKQPYKNPNDKRILELIAKGSNGTNLYDWWNVQQVKNISDEKTEHPCQIPSEVMDNIISITPAGIILDPFAGSGTTLFSAKRLGRKAIGIEIDRGYCEIIAKRLENVGFVF